MKYATFFVHLGAEAQKLCQNENISWEEAMMTQLKASKDLGVDGMTMGYYDLTPQNLKLVRDCGLRVDLVYWDGRLVLGENRDLLETVARKTADSGADVLMLIPGCCPELVTQEQSRKNAYPLARELVKHCQKLGVHCGIENYGGLPTTYSTVAGVKDYFDNVEGLGAVLDTGNCLWQRQDVMQMWDVMKDRIIAIHAKDLSTRKVEGVIQNHTPCADDLTPLPIGDGDLPFAQLLKAVRASGFDGGVTFEHDGYPDTMTFLKRSMDFWKKHW